MKYIHKPVIGLAGKAGTGKSTVATYLKEAHGYYVLSFADPIKHAIHEWFGIGYDILYGPSEHKNERVRTLMQRLGTEFGRTHDPEVWVKFLAHRLSSLCDSNYDPHTRQCVVSPGFVIEDVRFPNEAEFVAACPRGAVWSIRRTDPAGTLHPQNKTHESETAIDSIPEDLIKKFIHNNDTRADLERHVKTALKGL